MLKDVSLKITMNNYRRLSMFWLKPGYILLLVFSSSWSFRLHLVFKYHRAAQHIVFAWQGWLTAELYCRKCHNQDFLLFSSETTTLSEKISSGKSDEILAMWQKCPQREFFLEETFTQRILIWNNRNFRGKVAKFS